MPTWFSLQALFILALGTVVGFLAPITGAGGLVSVPGLILLGLPPHAAIAANRMGSLGLWIVASLRFHHAGKIVWKLVLPMTVISVLCGTLGAHLTVRADPEVLRLIVGGFVLATLIVLRFYRSLGVSKRTVSSSQRFVGFVLYGLLTVYGGFMGIGVGVLIYAAIMACFGLTILEAKGTEAIPWILLSVVSLVVYFANGIVDLPRSLLFTAGMSLGGRWGAHLAIEKGDRWLMKVFTICAAGMGAYLIYDGVSRLF